ncbi:hypothetical protein SOVF_031350 [Spinacia oleracea]|nr:hypothetical protein SOVF_031350 [Spinacia oleracea]
MATALLLYATLVFVSLTTSYAKDKPPLYVFGDSLFDAGMTLYTGVDGDGAEFWPYGQTYFNKPSGRYCDGRVIPDFLAQFAGWPHLRTYLQPGPKNYSQGINFAAASACVLVETRPGKINLALQMYYFVQMVRKLKQQVGKLEANKLLSKAVYLIDIGGNDYFSLFDPITSGTRRLPPLPLSLRMKKDYINEILGELTTHIYTLYNKGGRKFVFPNIGPLGYFPSMKVLCMLRSEPSCVEDLHELARMHNTAFSALAKRLQTRLPGFKYSIYDFYTGVQLRVINAHRFGFKESRTACCGSGPFNGDFTCQKLEHSFTVCSNPNDYLWFDAGHPTERANEQFAIEIWSGGSNVVAPYNLHTLLSIT